MAEKIISPGVFTTEIDQSFLPAAIGDIGAAVVGPTVKGPALVPTVVSSMAEYESTFGTSFKSGSATIQYLTSHFAENYLKHGNKLTVVRILDGNFSQASASISSAGADASTFASGSLTCLATDFAAENEFKITVGGTEYRFIAADPEAGIPASSSPIFYFNTGSSLANGLVNLTSSIAASGIGVTSPGGSATDLILSASTAGTDGNSITVATGSGTDFSQSIALTGGTNAEAGGGTTFTLNTIADGAIMNNLSPTGQTNNILQSGSADNLRWEISSKNDKKGTFNLLIRSGNDTQKRKNVIESWNNLSLDPNAKNYIAKVIGDSKYVYRNDGTDGYIEQSGSYPNNSKYVWVGVNITTVDYLDDNGNVRVGAASGSLPAVGSGSSDGAFQGGTNGYAGFDVNGDFSGTNTTANQYLFYDDIDSDYYAGFKPGDTSNPSWGYSSYNEALSLLNNADEYDINLLALPGITQEGPTAVIQKAIDVCEDRGDCFVIADPTNKGATVATAAARAGDYDSNYTAMYYPWVQINDNKTGQYRWVPPSVVMGGIYAFNDKVSHPWFAPAGLNRGGIETAIQAERKLTHGNRDDLYDSNMNPIATFPGQGVTVWGQKTLQKKASALDRINVRRLLIKVKKFIASSSRFLVFEQNNSATRKRFLNIANPYLEQVQSNSGLHAFKVVMDDTNNTPDVVDRNILYGQLFLQPTRTAEFIVLDFTIQPTGASFPE